MLLLVAARGDPRHDAVVLGDRRGARRSPREFALDAGGRAWLTMAVQAGFVAGTLVTALTNVADAINARRLFAAGCVAGAACNAAIAVAPGSPPSIIALRFCTGAALAWVYPPGMKIAAGWFRERRGTALGIVVGAVGVGSAFPHLLAWLGAGLPWRALVGASSVLALAGAAIVALARRGRPARQRVRPLRSPCAARRPREPRHAAGDARLLRAHVGALRDVDVDRGVRGARRWAPRRRRPDPPSRS